jgi:hypothetical protein
MCEIQLVESKKYSDSCFNSLKENLKDELYSDYDLKANQKYQHEFIQNERISNKNCKITYL